MNLERVKNVFLLTVLSVWAIVVAAALYNYLFNKGPLPDPILLGIPSGTWLALNPPIPRSLRGEQPPDAGT